MYIPLSLILAIALLVGCETTPMSTAGVNRQPPAVEGVIIGYEDGYVTLRLPSGKTQDFLDPDSGIVPSREDIIGRRCRVSFREGINVVGGGVATIPALEITNLEWL